MAPNDPSRATMTLAELARTLGVSEGTAARLVRARLIPSIRAGRRVLISRAVVDRVLQSGRWPVADADSGAGDPPRPTAPDEGAGR